MPRREALGAWASTHTRTHTHMHTHTCTHTHAHTHAHTHMQVRAQAFAQLRVQAQWASPIFQHRKRRSPTLVTHSRAPYAVRLQPGCSQAHAPEQHITASGFHQGRIKQPCYLADMRMRISSDTHAGTQPIHPLDLHHASPTHSSKHAKVLWEYQGPPLGRMGVIHFRSLSFFKAFPSLTNRTRCNSPQAISRA